MNKKKKIIIVSCIVITILTLTTIIILFKLKGQEKINGLFIDNEVNESSNNINNDNSNVNNDNKKDNNIDGTSNQSENGSIVSEEKPSIDTNEDSEDSVISYFEGMEKDVNSSTLDNLKEKFKEYFITIVDFIFYDKEIKGYTFDELTNSAKLKIISIALKIDDKIEKNIPGYKETISSTGNKVYTNIKERLVTIYMDISVKVCENNSSECEKAKEIFGEIKNTCKIGWDFIKELISNSASKIKEWYEIYSGK